MRWEDEGGAPPPSSEAGATSESATGAGRASAAIAEREARDREGAPAKVASPLAWLVEDCFEDLALFVLRVGAGAGMFFGHGWAKFVGYADQASGFPDPLGVGAGVSLALVVFAQFFCSLLVIAGLVTRLAALPLVISLLVALLVFHADDPWSKKELAFTYLVPFATLCIAGGGRWSADGLIAKIARARRQPR